MKVVAYEGIVVNGCVHLPADAHLPEKSKVYVVVPGMEAQRVARIWSPRLVNAEQAGLFSKMEVSEDGTNSGP